MLPDGASTRGLHPAVGFILGTPTRGSFLWYVNSWVMLGTSIRFSCVMLGTSRRLCVQIGTLARGLRLVHRVKVGAPTRGAGSVFPGKEAVGGAHHLVAPHDGVAHHLVAPAHGCRSNSVMGMAARRDGDIGVAARKGSCIKDGGPECIMYIGARPPLTYASGKAAASEAVHQGRWLGCTRRSRMVAPAGGALVDNDYDRRMYRGWAAEVVNRLW